MESVRDEYFASLIRTGLDDKAEKELASELKRNWRSRPVQLYGLAKASDVTKQLKRAETWLKSYPEDADLLLSTARLCLHAELWGKARSYLEAVINLRPTPSAYQEYGRLLNRLGDSEGAAEAFQRGLGVASESTLPSDVPRLKADSDASPDMPKLLHDSTSQ